MLLVALEMSLTRIGRFVAGGQFVLWQPRETAGGDPGPPLVLPVPCWLVIEKPVPVTLMHCWADVPQRLFMTTYRPPMVVLPYWSQIWVSAAAGPATANVVTAEAASRPAAAAARRTRLIATPGRERGTRGDG